MRPSMEKMSIGASLPIYIKEQNIITLYSASAVGVICNTAAIPELSADRSELGDAQYKDQLAIPDPEKSGACKDFVAGYVNANGWDDFQAMADNGMTVPGANKAALLSPPARWASWRPAWTTTPTPPSTRVSL